MPSVKSYQNRKAEIKSLLASQFELSEQRNRLLTQVEGLQMEVNRLQTFNQTLVNVIADNLAVQNTPIWVLPNKEEEIKLLKKEIEALKITLRQYRNYVLKAYDPDAADIIEIPLCLKPFDALKWSSQRGYLTE